MLSLKYIYIEFNLFSNLFDVKKAIQQKLSFHIHQQLQWKGEGKKLSQFCNKIKACSG